MQNILKSEKLQPEAFQTALKWNWPWRNNWTSRIVLHWSTSVLLETSLILFYPIYWYYLKMETNLFKFLSLISSSWFWDFKTSRPAAKKDQNNHFFLIFSRGCFSGDKPPRQPPFYAVWTWSFEQKTFETWLFEQKHKRTWFLFLLWRLKFWLIMIREQKAWICSYFKYFGLKKINPLIQKAKRSNKIKIMEIN